MNVIIIKIFSEPHLIRGTRGYYRSFGQITSFPEQNFNQKNVIVGVLSPTGTYPIYIEEVINTYRSELRFIHLNLKIFLKF